MLEQKHVRLLWLLAVACFSEGYDFALLTVALPQVRKTFHLTHTKADLWIALLYLGLFAAWTTGTAFAVEMFPTSVRGAASAAAAIAKLLGQSASFAIGALLLTVTHRPDATISVLVIGPLTGAVLIAFFLPETSRQELTDVVPVPTPAPAGGATVGP